MKTYRIQDRETGTVIEKGLTLEQAKELVAKFEETDREDETYMPDFYEIKEELQGLPLFIDQLQNTNKRERDRKVLQSLSGDHNKQTRQDIVEILTGEKLPKAKCGVTLICKLLDEGGRP